MTEPLPVRPHRLVAPGLSAPDLAELAAIVGDSTSALILSAVDKIALAAALADGLACYVEWTGAADTAAALARAAAALAGGDGGVALSLTTRTAYRALKGALVGRVLVDRGVISTAAAMPVARAVQEAIANAVIHGNLQVAIESTTDIDAFLRFHQAVVDRLAEPEAARRRVAVEVAWTADTVTVRVRDQGTGFEPASIDPAPPEALCGRGLTVMRAMSQGLAFEDGGRCTVLTFARAAP